MVTAKPVLKPARAPRLLARLLWLLLAVLLWQTGSVGRALTAVAAWSLPRALNDDWRLESLKFAPPEGEPARGVTLTVNPRRLVGDLQRASPWFRLLPPGLLRDGLCLRASWGPRDMPLLHTNPVPVRLCLDATAPDPPRLCGRMDSGEFNALVEDQRRERLHRRKKYIFGHYDMLEEYRFNTLTVLSEPAGRAEPVTARRLRFDATGRVRVHVEDGIVKVRTTGNVKRLEAVCSVELTRDAQGIGVQYRFDVTEMKLSADNMAPWLEKKLAGELRDSMEHSLNREKKQQRLARKRFPEWLPVDARIDLTVRPAQAQPLR